MPFCLASWSKLAHLVGTHKGLYLSSSIDYLLRTLKWKIRDIKLWHNLKFHVETLHVAGYLWNMLYMMDIQWDEHTKYYSFIYRISLQCFFQKVYTVDIHHILMSLCHWAKNINYHSRPYVIKTNIMDLVHLTLNNLHYYYSNGPK